MIKTRPYIDLLKELIRRPSFSGEEEGTASLIGDFMSKMGIGFQRMGNNIIVKNKYFNPALKSVILNSHHDTVRPNAGYSVDPFGGIEQDGKIIGLGSNDAGASLISLIAAFGYLYNFKNLKHNLVLIASAEEENSGDGGIRSVLPCLDLDIDLAIVGEPTACQAAIAEKGLLVIDVITTGIAGHAARPDDGKNAIDKAMMEIMKINQFEFERVSTVLGPVVKSVTQINAGKQHNVIPDQCSWVIDLRVNECYTLHEAFELINQLVGSSMKARSFKNNPSFLPSTHTFVSVIDSLGLSKFGSPTLSDQAHFACPSLKIGPGKSERSHQANEFVYTAEIEQGIDTYIKLLLNYLI